MACKYLNLVRRKSFDLRRAPGLGQLKAEQVDQVIGDAVQQQAEGIGEEVVTAQAVGAEAVLELLDAVLALTVVEGENLRLRSW